MRFHEHQFGEHRVYVGARDAGGGPGYIAAIVIEHRPACGRRTEVFRDEQLACGYRFESADAALSYAMSRARELIRRQRASGAGIIPGCPDPLASSSA